MATDEYVPISRDPNPVSRARRMLTVERNLREHRVRRSQQEPCADCGGGNPLLGCEDRDVCQCGSNWGDGLAARCEQQAAEAWRRRMAQLAGRDAEESA